MRKITLFFAALLISMTAFSATLYLTPNANWKTDNARFAAYFFGNGDTWVSMTAVEGETDLYSVEAPAGYPNVIFCRMNPGAATNNWDNKWNQTSDLTVPTDGTNHYTVKENTWDKGGGSWTIYAPDAPVTYTDITITVVANAQPKIHYWDGGDKMVGSDFNAKPDMVATGAANTYSYTIKDVNSALGVKYLLAIGDVQTADLHTTTNVTANFKDLLPQVVVMGVNNWDGTDKMTVSDDYKTATITLNLAAKTYEWKLTVNGEWFGGSKYAITRDKNSIAVTDNGDGNGKLTADLAGEYVFTYTYATENLTVTYPELAPAITATWSIEEGAELESFSEVTITFTGVDAATTTTMYPVCFYKVAADGTTTPVANDCTAGLLNRKASGASITLMVQEDEYDFCYDGKITAGNYRIVLSAGMVKFNNDNSNKNTEEYVLNFSIAGSDEPALEEIDAVYTVNPENNATVTEIREIVLNFTNYETITVADLDLNMGTNVPQFTKYDADFDMYQPCGYIFFKADTASANGLRLYIPSEFMGTDAIAVEGQYQIVIPAGVVTFADGISKAITLNYTVKAAPATVTKQFTYSYEFTAKQFAAATTKTLNEVDWTLAAETTYFGFDTNNGKGQQIGSGGSPAKTAVLSTTGIEGKITKIVVNTSGASSIAGTFAVTVNGVAYTPESIKLTTSATDYEFTGAETGEIKFTWTQTSSKALYIKSINIEYEKEVAADAVEAPVFSVEGGVKEEAFNLELTCATADAEIYYTLNGGAETKYTAAINIAATTTVKAWAVKGDKKSDEVTATYIFIEYIENATIAQVLAAEPSDYVWYQMTGVIDSLYNTTYGNFYFVDGQDTIIVYGLTATKVASNDKSFASLNLVEGDKITIWGTRSAFNGKPQVGGPAYFVEKVEEPVEPTPTIVEGTKLYVQFPTAYSVLQSSVTFGEKATGGKLSPVKRGIAIGGGTTTGTAMTEVDAENGVWEVVAPAGTSDSIFSVVFSIKGYTTACNIADLKYDGEHNLFTLSSDFAFDPRRGGTATEANGTWGVYPFPAPGITATWSIEEGAELESFSEVTITFTGVEAANTTTMYPVCFYKVAADGTTTPVANDCTAGLLNRKASGASITLMVQEDEYDFCYDGKITAGNYRIVLSAGMVKFNNDNSNLNTEDYVLNFSIKGSDEPALEEIDAVYTVNPENNAIVIEIREIVLNFTGYETIAVAEPDMATGRNIPTVYFEDELTGSMMPAGYIMFKADTASANGLRLYVDPAYTGGAESYAAEGKYAINIPAGVVTFTDGISKAITLNYTVKTQSAPTIEFRAEAEKDYTTQINGTVKRVLQNGENTIVLAHEEDGTAHIYVVDHIAGTAKEISQEGVIARDPENVGDYLAISDIALTEDGKLVACNYIRCQFDDSYVESGYKRGTLNVYIWNDLAAAPSIWFQSKASSNSLRSDQGYTMAVKGTSANAKVLVSGVHNAQRGIRMSRFNVIDGQYVDTKDGAGALPYYYYIGSNFKGASAGVDAAVYNEAAHGVNIQFNASPLVDTAWIFDAELVEPSEFLDKGTNGAEVVVNANIAEGTFGTLFNGASYIKYGEKVLMAAPYITADSLVAGVKVLDITNGFAEPVVYESNTTLAAPVAATTAFTSIELAKDSALAIYLFVDAKAYVFTQKPEIKQLEAKNAYAYDVKVVANEDKTAATVSYRLNAPATSVKVLAKVEGTVVKEVAGTTTCRYYGETIENYNEVVVSLDGLETYGGKLVEFEVAVEGTLVETPTEVAKNHRFYHPKGVEVDANPESEFFGRIYATEGMPVAKAGDTYISDVNGNGVGQGLYAFDATLAPIANEDGKYGFTGGLTFNAYNPAGKQDYSPLRVVLSDDGRLFFSRQSVGVSPLVEVNPADLNANFTEVFTGFVCDSTTYDLNTADGAFMAAPNVGFDVKGSGENLQVLMLSTKVGGWSAAKSAFRVDEYNLGEATTWSAAPSTAVEALSGKYIVTYTSSNVEYDNEGGMWLIQHRGSPSEAEPALVHLNAAGEVDYTNTSINAAASGFAFNADYTLLAFAGNGSKTCTVYAVGKDGNGAPTLTEKYNFATTIGTNLNDIAWDYANNLYLVGNSGEYLKVFALPRESAVVTTPAAERYSVKMPMPMEVEFANIAAIYEMGMWDMAYYESYSNYEVVALLKSQPTVVDKVVTSGMMGGNMNNYYLNDGTGVIVLQAEGDRYEPITDENWDVIGWDTISGLNIEVGKKLPVDFMANIDFKVVTDEETWLPTGEVYGAPVMTFVPKATGDVIVDEYGWETIVTESNEEFAARCEASDFVEEAVEANLDDVLANRIDYAGKLLVLDTTANYYAESNPYMGTMSAYMFWNAEEAFDVETYEEEGTTVVYVSPKYTEDYNNFAGKLFNINGEELPEAALATAATINVVNARFDWNSIAQGQTLVVKEGWSVEIPQGPQDNVENGELVVNIYSNNGSVYVEAEAGAMIEVYTVNGLRVYAGVSNTNTTIINGLNTNIAIIRVNGETYKVFVK